MTREDVKNQRHSWKPIFLFQYIKGTKMRAFINLKKPKIYINQKNVYLFCLDPDLNKLTAETPKTKNMFFIQLGKMG